MKNDELASVPLPSPEGGATPEFAKLAMVQTLAFKLIAAFIAVSLVGAAIGAIGVFGISRIQRLNQQMYSVDLLGLAAVKDANLALVAATTASADFLLSTTASLDQRQKQRETFEARVADVKRLSLTFRSSFDDDAGKALVARFDSSVAQWHEANQKFFEMVTGAAIGNVDEANESLRAAGNRVNEAMASLSRHKAERADLAARKSEETFVTTRNTVIGASLLGTALCCLVGFAVAKRITRPIAALAATSEKISSGDLNQQVAIDRSDEIGILQRNMKGMTESLNGVISQVISSSEHITAATEEIRQGTTDLSNRSEHQAASLSEATSMIQTLDGSVQHHAAEMSQANAQTGQAWQMTQQSGELVGGLVTSMGKMAERARKMADIVSVIDGIAQQTHILALNAAVEAARAGENGRGFSVVAHEVQALAKRSAEQASAVRELINASIEIVGQGTTIAEDARTKMDAAVQSVQRVTSLIEHVAGSAKDQSEQLTGALNLLRSLDQATQQNASLAEESAAATSLISEQALSLTRQIQHFRIATP